MNKKESATYELDDIDIAILRIIQREGRISNNKLAERVNLSETPCWRRWKRLEEAGYIDNYTTVLNRQKLNLQVSGFTLVTLGNHDVESTEPFEEFVGLVEWVVMCSCIAGSADYIVQIVAQSLEQYYDRLSELRRVKGVTALQSNMSIKEIKSTSHLPIG
ncbi:MULTISPECIES: Lrp/AsnC family transcriptional regulator [Vibrio]|jgi:DNA-binding Lrp family transcriptional regulator|uniref:AsnC family transcriptional regulator n=2 Tax=Vibrio TaxID=662 RepID=A0AAJ3EPK3_9VIBR|nr:MULTISPECIES: Lrp/AsnC family transcriptional regulator [Vibrio]ASI92841.1 AsnC family transcriptional regulator [Vibrio mediterranei]KFA98043.1 AsnC family transcriptional regulator [Vibrio sp. ER1A]MCF4176433.1 Lrp/AsnC family transcriptional regulator [Vibrio sp. McD22-P3]MCG9662890.1 Lrp/AsnC family transcriptional regulator [Vibrio mediterranei]MCY9856088.1 Lrp/AsnC family transcriptional regulator [Vibrio mediterranei]